MRAKVSHPWAAACPRAPLLLTMASSDLAAMDGACGPWAGLPLDVFECVRSLVDREDQEAMRLVCRAWLQSSDACVLALRPRVFEVLRDRVPPPGHARLGAGQPAPHLSYPCAACGPGALSAAWTCS